MQFIGALFAKFGTDQLHLGKEGLSNTKWVFYETLNCSQLLRILYSDYQIASLYVCIQECKLKVKENIEFLMSKLNNSPMRNLDWWYPSQKSVWVTSVIKNETYCCSRRHAKLSKKAVSEKLVSFLKFLMMLMSTNDEKSEKCIAPITKRSIFFTWKIF